MKKVLQIEKFLSAVLIVLATSIGYSNNNDDVEKLKRKALNEFDLERYHNAKEIMNEVIQHDPQDAKLHYSLGISCLHTSSFEKAIGHLEKAYKLDPEKGVDKKFPYWLGRAYHQNHQFDAALEYYYLYDESIGKHHADKEELTMLMQQASVGADLIDSPSNTLIVKMDDKVNTEFDDHSPIIAAEGSTVFYTSKLGLDDGKQDFNGDYYEKVFAVQKNNMGIWSAPKLVTDKGPHLHHSCIQLFDSEEKMLVYTSENKGSLHIAQLDVAGKWIVDDDLAQINAFHPNGNATISEDGKTLIFSKFVDKREENADLFMSIKSEEGVWSKPEPLKGNINTEANETAPFLSPDGKTFYFAADGERSMGGYDILKVDYLGEDKWSDPVNMGYPVNSAYHDIYFQENKNKTMAVFSSHREGGNGQLDIYLAYDVQMLNVKGNVAIQEGIDPSDVAIYFNSFGENHHPYSATAQLKEDGTFEKELVSDNMYKVFVTHAGEVIQEEVIKLDKVLEKGEEMNYTMVMNDSNIEILHLEVREDVIVLNYSDQKAVVKDYSHETLQSIVAQLNENENLKVTLFGNIGAIEAENYDLEQSKQIAHNVASYFLKEGISHKRILVKTNGKSLPVESKVNN